MNKILMGVLFVIIFSVSFISASLNIQLSDQGTGVAYTNGTTLNSGNLTVLIYTVSSGGSPIYNETFSNAITNGSWNVMLGSSVNLSLEFGKIYYKDYLIVGEDASFDGSDRQAFYSPLGDINGSDLAGDFYIDTIGNINTTGNISAGNILFDGSVNKTLSANSTSIFYYNGTLWIDLTQGSGNSSTNYWARNSTSNITILANSQDNVNLTNSNITTTGTGFFGLLGSLINRISTLFIQDINVNGTLNLTSNGEVVGSGKINLTGNIITTGNLTIGDSNLNTAIINLNGAVDIIRNAGANYGVVNVRNANNSGYSIISFENNTGAQIGQVGYGNTGVGFGGVDSLSLGTVTPRDVVLFTNQTEVLRIVSGGNVGIGTATPSTKLEINGTAKIAGDLNMTSNNITAIDCITFISGGKICNAA